MFKDKIIVKKKQGKQNVWMLRIDNETRFFEKKQKKTKLLQNKNRKKPLQNKKKTKPLQDKMKKRKMNQGFSWSATNFQVLSCLT